ncbi:MAG: NIPSNAP family protein [Cyclobacteriaceae bacterium]|nr:NIPSNAP family protein [Cyclobacteriaceae bacterium]
MKNNWYNTSLSQKLAGIFIICLLVISVSFQAYSRDFYQIKIYTLENEQQEMRMDKFLKDAFIPALHRAGISKVGVFKPVEDDDMAGKLIYVFIPFKSMDQFEKLGAVLNNDKKYLKKGSDYIDAAHDNAPYTRIESILLRSFRSTPEYGIPKHKTLPSERIYELRSYQGATEKLYEKKVKMFSEAGESKIFIDLGFQPIFFGEVISGSTMPNLMYLTTFENKASQDKHWTAFRESPDWLTLKADKQYSNTVSKSEKFYFHPTEYSEL